MENFCKKCGAMIEQAEKEEQLKTGKSEENIQYCLECASSISLAQLFEDQPEPTELES